MAAPNFANKTIWTGDNLDILRGLNSECVDLIYLDPPFNSNRDYAAPVGSQAAGAAFKDTWTLSDLDMAWLGLIADQQPAIYQLLTAAGLTHGKGMQAYLCMMAVRLLEMRRVLKPTGSIWLHCDDTAAHWLRVLMEAVFGPGQFQNEVVWQRVSNHNDAGRFGRTGDRLLFYGATIHRDAVRVPLSAAHVAAKYRQQDERGHYGDYDLTGAGLSAGESGQAWQGYVPGHRGRHWSVPRTGAYAAWIEANLLPGYRAENSVLRRLDRLNQAGLIVFTRQGTPRLKRYLAASLGQVPPDIWTDIPPVNSQAKERVGYPTQKPLALLERIIAASSKEGDVVLDPFCGCATTLVAAEKLGCQWAGIDLSAKAVDLVKLRLSELPASLRAHRQDVAGLVTARTDIPHRTDVGELPPYRQQKHVLFGQQEGRCNGCETEFPFRAFDVDHVVPQSRGGTDHADNLQLLCSHCNRVKGNRPQEYLIARLRELGLR